MVDKIVDAIEENGLSFIAAFILIIVIVGLHFLLFAGFLKLAFLCLGLDFSFKIAAGIYILKSLLLDDFYTSKK